MLTLVVPCYNEEAALPRTNATLLALLAVAQQEGLISPESHVLYVDDGSVDGTWNFVDQIASEDSRVRGLRLSRNCGHQNALIAGYEESVGDVVVSLDADLQDDPQAVLAMLDAYARGAEVVLGVRSDRSSDSWYKRRTAEAFYGLMPRLGVPTTPGHADFRLMSRRAIDALLQYREVNLFLRGMVPLVGFRTEVIEYVRSPRREGESKYPTRRMLGLALDAVTSFSVAPLRLVTSMGALVFAGSVAMSLFVVATRLFTDQAVPGWASTVVPIYVLGGVQLLSLGIIGEYLGKTYRETKLRPRYHVAQRSVAASSSADFVDVEDDEAIEPHAGRDEQPAV